MLDRAAPISLKQPEDRFEERVTFIANPIQRNFIISKAKADLMASRMGEGKSAGLVWSCYHHTKYNPGARWLFMRDTWENLRDTTQKEFFDWFPHGVAGRYKAGEKTFYWNLGNIKGEVQWRGIDTEKNATKLQSRPLGAFAIDEPAPAAHSGGVSALVFTTAMSRLRQKGMKWYAAKLATNNPDESHWSYKFFVDPGRPGYVCWQTQEAENLQNLPVGYYDDLRVTYSDRPDLVRRFVDGVFGFQKIGRAVTPAWNDKVHLVPLLHPVPRNKLHLLWDFGLSPTCLITDFHQGHWRFLEALVGEDMGTQELIEQMVAPLLQAKYAHFEWDHTHDPSNRRDDSSSQWSPVRVIREKLGGKCYPGAIDLPSRIEPLNAALAQLRNGTGLIQVCKTNARPVWYCLRGGWHYSISPTGVVSGEPKKDEHSHPGDAASYGASRFFPQGRLRGKKSARKPKRAPGYFARSRGIEGLVGTKRSGAKVPKEARTL